MPSLVSITLAPVSALVFALVLAAPAQAQAFTVRSEPSAPQGGQPFEIIVSGFWPTATLPAVRDVFIPGYRSIVITLAAEADDSTVVTPLIARAAMPALAPGVWDVDVRVQQNGIVRRLTSGQVTVGGTLPPFDIGPAYGGTSGGQVVTIYYPTCNTATCSGMQVFFGDRAATQVDVQNTIMYVVTPPSTRVGPVDVRVRVGSEEHVRHGAYTYVSPAQYETVLLPSHTDDVVPGGFGSRWQVDSGVYNDNLVEVELEKDYLHFHCYAPITCLGPQPILPRAVSPIPSTTGIGREPNWLMHIRRPVADNLRFSMRVRDVSRQDQTWGTELPVVRERDFASRVQLFDVPLHARFRQTLRVYALPAGTTCCTEVTVRFYSLGGTLLHTATTQLRRSDIAVGTLERPGPGSPDFPMQPENATLDFIGQIPELAGHESIRLELDGGSRAIWGYVNVINNETQSVTVVSPQ